SDLLSFYDTIQRRSRLTAWFKSPKSEKSRAKRTATHEHFTGELKQAFGLLFPRSTLPLSSSIANEHAAPARLTAGYFGPLQDVNQEEEHTDDNTEEVSSTLGGSAYPQDGTEATRPSQALLDEELQREGLADEDDDMDFKIVEDDEMEFYVMAMRLVMVRIMHLLEYTR
ncbi:hypothetical protein LTS18_010750, partial [Coniosporium uncinatum]